jgi:putative transcription factor
MGKSGERFRKWRRSPLPGRKRDWRVSDRSHSKSLEERLERLKRVHKRHILTGQIEDLMRRVDALPTLDSRPEDEILGYGEDGIPR